VGRLESLEIVVDDPSISRRHAELRATDLGWVACDLGSTNGTFLNGVRIGRAARQLRRRDVVQCGNVALMVAALQDEAPALSPKASQYDIQAVAQCDWDQAIDRLHQATVKQPQAGEQLATLLRAGHHQSHTTSLPELLQRILDEAVTAFAAQRGAIVLLDETTGRLNLRVIAGPKRGTGARFSKTLAQRSLSQGESLLCQNISLHPELLATKSIHRGGMASIVCALIRSPRKRIGILHLDRGPLQEPFAKSDLDLADAIAASAAAGIESAQLLERERMLVEQQRDLFLQTVTALAHAVDLRDRQTGGNSRRVTDFAVMLAEELEVAGMERYRVQIGTPLRDIGKIGIPEAILQKPDRLTPEEFELVKLHVVKGVELLSDIPELEPVLPIVRSHHENWDGTGYPDGLAGEQISRLARIVAVADAFDAMISTRPHRPALSPERAFAEIWDKAGIQFDPACVQAFLRLRPRIEKYGSLELEGKSDSATRRKLASALTT
jgi:HD-GYP domain-containing protein (c-di-GMP phosphodiesterase class II)